MTSETVLASSRENEVAATPQRSSRRALKRWRTSLLSHGEPIVWLMGGSLILALVMIAGLLLLLVIQGTSALWPAPVVRLELHDGTVLMGEVTGEDDYPPNDAQLATRSPEAAIRARDELTQRNDKVHRRLLTTGNFELTQEHSAWVNDFDVASESRPEWALVIERLEWGRFYGFPKAFREHGVEVESSPAQVWARYLVLHDEVRERWRKRENLKRYDLGRLSKLIESRRLEVREIELDKGKESPEWAAAEEDFLRYRAAIEQQAARVTEEIRALDASNQGYELVMTAADQREATLPLASVVRAYPANQLGWWEKLRLWGERAWEFVSDWPREANSEGGVWPAIFGTVVLTLIMCVAVVPLGVCGALYLREYARAGPLVSAVRIAVNNLAGVPSIVFGVFGLGCFCYILGANVDELLFRASLPSPTYGTGGVLWASLTLALLTLPVVIVATEEAVAAVPSSMREGSYACGASKWQTIRRIVLPRAMPGIMTGAILAVARGAGEVAPLMLVGAVKLAPDLLVDSVFPYLHPERSFMHLGFHIYDLAFQSQNSQAARPMVFTTTLLLILIIAALNVTAILLRGRLRKRFVTSQF
ncbi:MAG: phosphate ABC transporter permease PstA [Planctomycetota bacterium]